MAASFSFSRKCDRYKGSILKLHVFNVPIMVDVKQRWYQSTPGCCLLSSFNMALGGLNRRLDVSEGALS